MKPTAADKRRFSLISSLGCIVCGSPAQVHHVRKGCGMGQRDHTRTIPLCPWHHTMGGTGNAIHASQRVFERKFGAEDELLDKVNGKLRVMEQYKGDMKCLINLPE